MKNRSKYGFTLIELLVVIGILAIISLLAVPKVIEIYKNAKLNAFLIEAKEMYKSANTKFVSENLKGNVIENISNNGAYSLKMDEDLDYFIRLDTQGSVDYLELSDSEYCLQTTKKAQDLDVTDIIEGKCGSRIIVGPVKYLVKYDANGGTGSISDQEFIYGEDGTITSQKFTRVGYEFLGWNTDKNATTPLYTGGQVVRNLITDYDQVITMYAVWKANTYTLRYHENGGVVSPSSTTVTYGSNYGNLATPTKFGYGFSGWYTEIDGGERITSTTKHLITSDIDVYAHWTANTFTLYYNANGGSVSPSSKSVSYDVSYGDLATPTRDGYTFNGWYTLISGGDKVVSTNIYSYNGNSTIYAHWTARTYTLTYNANGGSVSSTSKTVTYNSAYGTLATPSRSGYTFNGWYTSSSGGSQVTSTNTYTTIGDSTIYAHWSANTYTLTYNANGGSVSSTSKTVTYNSTYGTLVTPTRSGHTFNGWYTSASGGTKVTSTTTYTTVGNSTIYAHWTANYVCNSGTLTYDSSKGYICVVSGQSHTGWEDCDCGWYTSRERVTDCDECGCANMTWDEYCYTLTGDNRADCLDAGWIGNGCYGGCGTCYVYDEYYDCDSCPYTYYSCPSGYSNYSGSGSSLKCYKYASLAS